MQSSPTSFARLNDSLHAFARISPSRDSSAADGALQGWPIAIKDCFDLAGEIASIGSPMFAERRPARTAVAVQRLLDAGASIVGHTHMVELAFGGWGINAAMGTPRNPWDGDTVRVAGGSSSGSAVAVAARMVPAALGSDTAGSVRMPAALCGITDLKTTFGLVPEAGVFPLAPSYDSVGPMAQSAEDCLRLFEVLTHARLAPLEAPRGWRISVLDVAAYPVLVESAVQTAIDEAVNVLVRLGAHRQVRSPPFVLSDLTRDAGTLIGAEAWTLHRARFEANPSAFGADLHRRFELARLVNPGAVASARTARIEASERFRQWLALDEVLLMPTVHCSAPSLTTVDERGSPLGQFTAGSTTSGVAR